MYLIPLLYTFLSLNMAKAFSFIPGACKVPKNGFQGTHAQDYLECQITRYGIPRPNVVTEIEYKCGDRGKVIYNGVKNILSVDITNPNHDYGSMTVYVACLNYKDDHSFAHANIHFSIPPHSTLLQSYPGMNYKCDLSVHRDTQAYAYTIDEQSLSQCRKQIINPVGHQSH